MPPLGGAGRGRRDQVEVLDEAVHHAAFAAVGDRDVSAPQCGGEGVALVAIAARVTQTPGFGSTPSTEYILFTPGHVLETAKGHVPPRLAGLTNTLSQLIDR